MLLLHHPPMAGGPGFAPGPPLLQREELRLYASSTTLKLSTLPEINGFGRYFDFVIEVTGGIRIEKMLV